MKALACSSQMDYGNYKECILVAYVINTALLDKRLDDMEKRLLEKIDTLENFQSVKPLVFLCVLTLLMPWRSLLLLRAINFFVVGFDVCQQCFVYHKKPIVSMDGKCGFKVWLLCH